MESFRASPYKKAGGGTLSQVVAFAEANQTAIFHSRLLPGVGEMAWIFHLGLHLLLCQVCLQVYSEAAAVSAVSLGLLAHSDSEACAEKLCVVAFGGGIHSQCAAALCPSFTAD